jgi:hypothetical protein
MLEIEALDMKIDLDNYWTRTVKCSFDMKVVRLQSSGLSVIHFRDSTDKGGKILSQFNAQRQPCSQGRRTSPRSRKLIKN